MDLLVILPTLACVTLALLAALVRNPVVDRFSGLVGSVVVLAGGIALSAATLGGSSPTALGGLLRVDALSAFMLAVVGAVGTTALWGALAPRDRPKDWLFATLVCLFLGSMSLAVVADNLGVLWISIEATTISTAFLVGHGRSRRSIEAAWKYVVLASVGVAIAFLGIVLLYAATLSAGDPSLSWSHMIANPSGMNAGLVRVAAGLMVLGFATKAGLAPMHSWLPDAHSQAPAPISGLMSGVLLSVSFYAILRVQAVVDPVIGKSLVRSMLLVAALLSLAVAAALILRQRDLKRMLAYSSIEHMGVLALAAAIGGTLALSAALLHLLGHGLAKSSTFVSSGRILETEGTTRIAAIRALLVRRPGIAVPFLLGMVVLLGFPPFTLFFTEVAIVTAGFQGGLGIVTAMAVALLLVLFGGLARHTSTLVFGGAPDTSQPQAVPDRGAHGPVLPLALALLATAVLGFASGPLTRLLVAAAGALGGLR